ncbi:hypothetical protein [Subtercola sp. YIM 133946]|uniref:hypothetical protein n=1 Tax=Subtercola sp. YIM 133946 TaxID=3118909 RepID=UPI002F94E48F
MALFNRLRGISQPIEAEFRIAACSANSGGAVYENCTMDGVVFGAGIVPVSVHHTSLLPPTAKWPYPGVVLPVTLDHDHPERLTINWAEVPKSRDVARQLAAESPQRMASSDAAAASASAFARANSVESEVLAAPGRPAPGARGGGLTPAESAQAAAGGAGALGLRSTTAIVLAAHEVAVPSDLGAAAPGGVWDVTLDVDAAPGYSTVMRISFSTPDKRARIASIGRQLPVLADPIRQDRIMIDTFRL